ncbi:MAG: lytic transglycosylase domain-containing protein [Myxococcales bacterium]|nr:lytic transglycosylase domain-containing protein [Myxococcales bacterium]
MLSRWTIVALLLGAVATPTASADIWECRGKDGSTHYTNQQRRGMRCKRVVKGSRQSDRPSSRSVSQGLPSRRDPSPHRFSKYDEYIREAARLYQLPESFIRAVMRVESNFSYEVISKAGAVGLMQLMPATARNMGVTDPFDPRQNILGGTRFLRILANKFNGDLVLTVAAYNAGQGAVDRHGGVPPYEETRRYVRRVLTHYYEYRLASQSATP